MYKINNMEKGILLLLMSMLILSSLDAQTRKEKKEQRRAVRDSLENVAYMQAVAAIQDTLLVLEADQAFDSKGAMVNVESTLNFVKIEKDRCVFQLAFPFLIGPNGVGGITLDGSLTNYEVKVDKKGRTHLSASSFGNSLNADIRMTLVEGSSRVEATVSAATLSYNLRFSGELKHIYESNSFEGTPSL